MKVLLTNPAYLHEDLCSELHICKSIVFYCRHVRGSCSKKRLCVTSLCNTSLRSAMHCAFHAQVHTSIYIYIYIYIYIRNHLGSSPLAVAHLPGLFRCIRPPWVADRIAAGSWPKRRHWESRRMRHVAAWCGS